MAEIAHIKRLLERWEGDDEFRQLLTQDPAGTARRYGLQADAEAVRPLWDMQHACRTEVDPAVQRYRHFVQEKLDHREELRRTSRPRSERFHAWRQRQMVRTTSQLGFAKSHGIVHPLAAFELSKGCSVGCWFCGVSAPRLGDLFTYTDHNRGLWRDICAIWREEIGESAEQAFLYWATDPMDNPDYEKFCCDFHELCGAFPQTTTALPLRDVARTKRLLQLSEERGCLLNRFSLLTLKILQRVHEEFSAEEMAFVELVLQIRKETESKAVAGRAMEKALKQGQEVETSTIACVSGFLINMVEGSIKLISPCPASAEHPLGYRIYAQGSFSSAEEFRRHLLSMLAKLSVTVGPDDPVALRAGLDWNVGEKGLTVSSPYLLHHFPGLPEAALQRLGSLLAGGGQTASSLALQLDADMPTTFWLLNQMLKVGALEEGP